MITFDRPVGASGDVHELEYISALHQTDYAGVRHDGSIRDDDIRLFLLSRYGLDVSADYVRETVMHGLAGASGDDGSIDLMELVAILLIPTLLKAAQAEAFDVPLNPKLISPKSDLLAFVLSMILNDVTGDGSPKPLNAALMKQILKAYGEVELAEDDKLVEEMVRGAQPPSISPTAGGMASTTTTASPDANNTILDLHSFARGLTYDVQLYDIANEYHLSSNYDDVFHRHRGEEGSNHSSKSMRGTDEESAGQDVRSKLFQPMERQGTASAIDFVAGTYRSKALTVLLWAAFIFTYFAYNFNFAVQYTSMDCQPYDYTYKDPWTHNRASIACGVGRSFLRWLIMFVMTSVYGLLFVGLGSVGNSVYCKWFARPLIGMMVVFCGTFFPFWTQKYQNQKLSRLSNNYLRLASLILGSIVCAIHLAHALTLYYANHERFADLRRLYNASTLMGEARIKHAAATKLKGMVQNAFDLLRLREFDGVVDTYFGHGLFAYSKHGKRFRSDGGYFWTWKKVFNNELMAEEGMWFTARFLASNISQYIVSIFVLLAGIGLTIEAGMEYDSENPKNKVTDALKELIDTTVNQTLVTTVTDEISATLTEFMKLQKTLLDCRNLRDKVNQTALNEACLYETDLLTQGVTNTECDEYILSVISSFGGDCNVLEGAFQCVPNANVKFDFTCAALYLTDTGTAGDASRALAFLTAAGYKLNTTRSLIEKGIKDATDDVVESFYPASRFMVMLPLVAATIMAFAVAIYLATIYLPSVTSTTLQLRSGVIPTLHDKNFHKYRAAADRITIVTGSMFWGALFSSTLVGAVVGGLIFFFTWQVTVFFAQKFAALVAGLLVVIIIKLLLLQCCRCAMYKAFYRKHPASANITSLALECANFALSVGFIFIRMIKLLFATAIYIGRIDTHFLAPGVGRLFGFYELDFYPYIYREDILSSEAHRHPYIDTLGTMYLMKLRYRDTFGKTAGSCWRLLFVYALMPWMHKYRVLARPNLRASMVSGGVRSLRNIRSLKELDSDDDDDDDDFGDPLDGDDNRSEHKFTGECGGGGDAIRKSTSRQSSGGLLEPRQFRGPQGVPNYMEASWRKSVSRIDKVVKVLQEQGSIESVSKALPDTPKQQAAARGAKESPPSTDEQDDSQRRDSFTYQVGDVADEEMEEYCNTGPATVESVVAGLEELKKEMADLMMANDDLKTKLHRAVSKGRSKRPLQFQW